jgi:GntR family histidine utilization transcriptional repressor
MREPTLHQRIVSDLEGNILSGRWQPGHRLPFEMELARDYACSRMTVNKALIQLARSGLIERRRKSGSFVTRPASQSAVLEIRDIRADVVAMGLEYSYELLARRRRKASREDEARLGAVKAGEVLELECRHMAGGEPFCCEQRIVALGTVPDAAGEAFEHAAPGPWLLQRVPWSSAQHVIRAAGADTRVARVLGVKPGTPCLAVERLTTLDGAPVTHVRLTWPGDRHELVAQFEPSTPPAVRNRPSPGGREH